MQYDFLVPKAYGSGAPVEIPKFECLEDLLREFFEGYSKEAGAGGWRGDPEEEHIKYTVDVRDDAFTRTFFQFFRRVLERWFRQERIWMGRIKIELV